MRKKDTCYKNKNDCLGEPHLQNNNKKFDNQNCNISLSHERVTMKKPT